MRRPPRPAGTTAMSPWTPAFALMALTVALALLLPLLLFRGGARTGRGDSALAVHRQRLDQLARDREAGLIGPDEAAGAEAEIKRAILAAGRTQAEVASRGARAPVALMAGAALATGIGVYALTGAFGTPDRPLAARDLPSADPGPSLASEHRGGQMQEAIDRLRQRLAANPDSVEDWTLLARSYGAIGAHAAAAEAYERLIALAPQDPGARGDRAEALVRRDDGFVGPAAVAGFEAVLAAVPDDPRARYYLALRDAQAGRDAAAAQGFAAILADAPGDAPYRPAVRRIMEALIEDAGLDRAELGLPPPAAAAGPDAAPRGPDSATIAAVAQMPAGEQLSMIRGMVARLETRLDDDPGDVEGWLRLARSRAVLGEPGAAKAALERGLAANPGSQRLRAALAESAATAAE